MSAATDHLALVRDQAEVVRKLTASERFASDTCQRANARWSGVACALAAITSHPDAYAKVKRLEREAHAAFTAASAQLARCVIDTDAARATLRGLEYPAAKDGNGS